MVLLNTRIFTADTGVETEVEKIITKTEAGQNIEMIVDNDPSLGYETSKWLYTLSLPLMWFFTLWSMLKRLLLALVGIKPKTNTFWFDGLSKPCREIKEGAASWRALEIIYNYQFGIGSKLSDYWLGIVNAKAVRNRLKLVKRELLEVIKEVAQEIEGAVELFSIASGSAQAVIETMVMAKEEGIEVKATLLDLDQTAIDYSQELALRHGLEDKVVFVRTSTTNLEKAMNGKRPHIVEMIGFLDYRPHPKAVALVQRIYDLLLPGGRFLTANTSPNSEQYFMKWVINWSMIYRRPKELWSVVTEGGFKRARMICEPLKLHMLAICQK